MKYLVLDIETESSDYHKRFSDPFEPTNKIVMVQAKEKGKIPAILYKPGEFIDRNYLFKLGGFDLLVGQNIRYDLLYLWKNESIQAWIKAGGKIWDTKVVEYLLNGQNKEISLHLTDMAPRYGGKPKQDLTSDLYKKGLKTLQIIQELGLDVYKEYAAGDVINTEIVFQGQYKRAVDNQLLGVISTYMMHYLAMLEIESNGIYFDEERLQKEYRAQEVAVARIRKNINTVAKDVWPKEIEFDVDSSQHISALLFGGEFTVTVKEPLTDPKTGLVFYFKTGAKKGQPRFKNVEVAIPIVGLSLDVANTRPMKAGGVFATGDDVLQKLDHPLAKEIIRYREKVKLLTTYYKGFLDCLNPHTQCVHSEFNLAGTRTGRLASRNPNVQNLHPKILECIRSRYEGGYIVECDWKQLEVVLAALLSGDEILLEQLAANIDMHLLNASQLFNKHPNDVASKERKLAKSMTFGIFYGSGPGNMSAQHSIDMGLAKTFIEQFYTSYPQIKAWHNNLMLEAQSNKYMVGDKFYGFIRGWDGKRYHLEMYPAKYQWQLDRGITHSFLPTEVKNYPVQGFASDIMAFFVGKVYEYLQSIETRIKMIDEVHDSLILDVPKEEIKYFENGNFMFKQLVQETNEHFNAFYKGIPLLKLEHMIGKTWAECKGK